MASYKEISADFPFEKKRVSVLDSNMAYVDTGEGENTLVFLHGNPTSSYLWRNIIPHVCGKARCIAPDLIGMGDSDKVPELGYYIRDHKRYLDAFMNAVLPDQNNITLVVHDWGSALGFDWARRHAHRVSGLAFMEFVPPIDSWANTAEGFEKLFRLFRTPEVGRRLLIDEFYFVEVVLPRGVVRPLTEREMNAYRAPFTADPIRDREPTYRFPNEIPIEGSPPEVWDMAQQYHKFLLETDIPKLFFRATPGAIIPPPIADFYAKELKNVRSIELKGASHFVQEDHPHTIGRALAEWLDEVVQHRE